VNKDFNQAEVLLKEIIESNPKEVKNRIILANLIAKRSTPENNRTNEAIAFLDQAIKIESNKIEIYIFKTALLIKQKNYKRALDVAKSVQKQFTESSAGKLLEADIYRKQKKYKKALPIYQQAYKQHADKKILASLIETLITLEQYNEAIELLTESIKKDPNNITNLFILASLLQTHQQVSKAQQYYQKILEITPTHLAALNNLAWIHLETDTKKALALAEKAYKQAPKSAAIMDTYGYILAKNGEAGKALKFLKKAFSISPDDNDIQYHLAYAYYISKDKRRALQFLTPLINNKSIFSEKNNAKALYKKLKTKT
jgi:tetratricopeptide (TPR) repeat protein